jgi:hypothetical protein
MSLGLDKGYNYLEAKRKAKELLNKGFSNLHVTYGTRTKKFHFIGMIDKDYNRFDMPMEKFIKGNKELTKRMMLSPSIWRI